jgi:hypothetical protein
MIGAQAEPYHGGPCGMQARAEAGEARTTRLCGRLNSQRVELMQLRERMNAMLPLRNSNGEVSKHAFILQTAINLNTADALLQQTAEDFQLNSYRDTSPEELDQQVRAMAAMFVDWPGLDPEVSYECLLNLFEQRLNLIDSQLLLIRDNLDATAKAKLLER